MTRCLICGWYNSDELCSVHKKLYVYDNSIKGFRLKKRDNGSRYTKLEYHDSETKLVKVIEKYYGKDKVVTSFHPEWAKSDHDVLLEFDILIKDRKILIEYNGIQHYEYPNFFHKTKKQFINQQNRDKLKKKLAKNNEYKLVIFRYDEPLFEDYVISKIEGKI